MLNSENDPVLNGQRNHSDVLWGVNISSAQQSELPPTPITPSSNAVILLGKKHSDLATYLHTDFG